MTTDPLPELLPADTVRISGLRIITCIGVPDEERETPQSVEAFVTLHPQRRSLAGLDDKIEQTIDYYNVSQRVRQLAATGERRLIETLAEEIADVLLSEFPVRAATVEIREFILADTDYVAATISKERAE